MFKLKETNLILANGIQQLLLLLLKQTHEMMAEVKRRRRRIKPMEEAIQFSLLQKDKNGLDGRFISDFKGELNVLIEPIFYFLLLFLFYNFFRIPLCI